MLIAVKVGLESDNPDVADFPAAFIARFEPQPLGVFRA